MNIELHNEVLKKVEAIAEFYYDLGELLVKIVDEEVYEQLGYTGTGAFERYCEEELGRSYQVVRSYIRIYTNLTAVHIGKEDLKNISFRAAEQVSRIITEETKEEWLELARKLSVRQLTAKVNATINAAKGADYDLNMTSGIEDKTKVKYNFKFLDHDADYIQQALSLADAQNNCDGNLNRALKCMAQDYVTVIGENTVSPEMALSLMNDRYGWNLTIQQALASKEQGVSVNA
jgi:hypothetical protein